MDNAAHPGAILREWMGEDITVTDLARHFGICRPTLSNILNGSAGVTAPMAIKLAEAFPATTARLWVTLQSNYELSKALREERRPLAALRPVSGSPQQQPVKTARKPGESPDRTIAIAGFLRS